jgi:hypothetical protein
LNHRPEALCTSKPQKLLLAGLLAALAAALERFGILLADKAGQVATIFGNGLEGVTAIFKLNNFFDLCLDIGAILNIPEARFHFDLFLLFMGWFPVSTAMKMTCGQQLMNRLFCGFVCEFIT